MNSCFTEVIAPHMSQQRGVNTHLQWKMVKYFVLDLHTLFYLRMFCLYICMYTTYILGVYGNQKRTLDPLDLEL